MINYAWNIKELQVSPSEDTLENVVKTVSYIVTATDNVDNLSTTVQGSVGLSPIQDPSQFIAYESLTESTIISWIQNIVDMVELESQVLINFDLLRNPVVVNKPLPW